MWAIGIYNFSEPENTLKNSSQNELTCTPIMGSDLLLW